MRFICIYCDKILDKSNFADFIRDSGNEGTEYHAWRHLILQQDRIILTGAGSEGAIPIPISARVSSLVVLSSDVSSPVSELPMVKMLP